MLFLLAPAHGRTSGTRILSGTTACAEAFQGEHLTPAETAHAFLRRVTSPWHQTTEDAFACFDVATLEGARAFLRAQSRAVLPLEADIGARGILEFVPDWPSRMRGDALCQDLQTLKTQPAEPLPVILMSQLQALGALYVLEGSRLGGALLHRRAMDSRVPAVRDATGFFGHKAGPQGWRRFLTILNTAGRDNPALLELQIGAETAFALFGKAARGA